MVSEDPYKNAARTYDLLIGTLNVGLKRERRRLAPPVRGAAALDVGCGTGSDLELYAQAGCRVYGVDLSPAMLRVARHRLGERADLRLCNALQLPFKDGCFDLVLTSYTLHEIPNRDRSAVVKEMMRVVKPSGLVLLTDYLPRRFTFPAGWITAMLIFIFEFSAGLEHFRNGRDFLRRGGVDGLVRRGSLSVVKRRVVGGGNIAFFLLSAQPAGRKRGGSRIRCWLKSKTEDEMHGQVLVAYATKYGATAEIAEKIGEVLVQAGLPTDVSPVNRIKDLSPYRAVVLGSAVYIGRWRKEASRFVKNYEKQLAERPVWVFSSGPTGKGDPVHLTNGWRLPKALQPVVDRIQPREVIVFHGGIDVNKMKPLEKWMIEKVNAAVEDSRDWEAITSWAKAVAEELKREV